MIYYNNNRIKFNIWSFIHINILYVYQRTSIMIWLNTIHGLTSKYIKTLKYSFDFINLYKNSVIYFTFLIVTTLFF